MELRPGSSTTITFVALDLRTIHSLQHYNAFLYANIHCDTRIFFTGNTPVDTVRQFRSWLFQLIASRGGWAFRFESERVFEQDKVIMFHQMPGVSYNIILLANTV